MADSAINRRKSVLFLTNFSPVYDTHNEVIRKKLKSGKFPQTKTGIIKMVGMAIQLGSIISWTVLSQKCDNSGISYTYISSISLSFGGQLILFLIFSFGQTVKDPGSWIYGDIFFNFFLSLFTIITSILSMKMCNKQTGSLKDLSEALAMCGAGISICSCAGLFLMYRFIEDPDDGAHQLPRRAAVKDPRKSIFA